MKISSFAKAAAYPESNEKLVELIAALDENRVPFITVGKMSNVLFKNKMFDGVIVITSKNKTKNVAENYVTLSCGCSLSEIARQMAKCNLGGFEGLYGIPGTVGGMVRQNAGAFGYEVSDRFLSALCYVRSEKALRHFEKSDMLFSYRDSILSDKDIILLSATFSLLTKSHSDIFAEIKSYSEKRRGTQPSEPSLGSVFKRHNGISAGYYIDKAGLKGFSIGGAKISEKHAGFIINTGEAVAVDFLALVQFIKDKVYTEFGIELKEEFEIIE